MRYWASLPHTSIEQTRAHVAKVAALPPGEAAVFSVMYEGRYIGTAGVWQWPEIGYGIDPAFWGRGLAREAVSAVIGYMFGERPAIDAITARVDPRNVASIGLLKRLGFAQTGYGEKDFLYGEEWLDTAYFALRRPVVWGTTQGV